MGLFGRTKVEDEVRNAGYRASQLYQILFYGHQPTMPTDARLEDNEFCYDEVELNLYHVVEYRPGVSLVVYSPVQVALTNDRIFLRYIDGNGAWEHFWHGKITHLTVDLQKWSLTLSYEDGAVFRLDGPDIRACALVAGRMRCGPSVMQEPWFTMLAA